MIDICNWLSSNLGHDVVGNDVVAIITILPTLSFFVVVFSDGISVVSVIRGLCGWGVRSKKKAEEEEYQVHNETIYFVNQ